MTGGRAWPRSPAPALNPGQPAIILAHYPDHPQVPAGCRDRRRVKAATEAEEAFLAIGAGAERVADRGRRAGTARIRAQDGPGRGAGRAGRDRRSRSPRWARPRWPGRFGDGDLASIAATSAAVPPVGRYRADEAHSVQPGTFGWDAYRPMTTTAPPIPLDHQDAVFIRDVST